MRHDAHDAEEEHAGKHRAQDRGTGRDASGRFTAGNKYGPGNPFARQTAELRKVLLEVVTPEQMRQVAYKLLLLAQAGKLEAIKLLFQYVIGKPAAPVDPVLSPIITRWVGVSMRGDRSRCADPYG